MKALNSLQREIEYLPLACNHQDQTLAMVI